MTSLKSRSPGGGALARVLTGAAGVVGTTGVEDLMHRYRQIGCVDGKGLVAGLACVIPGTKEPDAYLAFEVVRRTVEKGVLMFSPVGTGGATVKIAPPLVITEEAIADSMQALEEAFAEATGEQAAVA